MFSVNVSESLREEMDFDMSAIYELQLAIYVFQEAVSMPLCYLYLLNFKYVDCIFWRSTYLIRNVWHSLPSPRHMHPYTQNLISPTCIGNICMGPNTAVVWAFGENSCAWLCTDFVRLFVCVCAASFWIDWLWTRDNYSKWITVTSGLISCCCFCWCFFNTADDEQVGEILRQRHIQPHWMFALDNLLRSAVQCAITVISPGS